MHETTDSYPWTTDPWNPSKPAELQPCPHCGKGFEPKAGSEYCSPACAKAENQEEAKKRGDREASLVQIDPYAALAANVILQAVKDLADQDPLTSLDALDFWTDPGGGAVWLDALGLAAGAGLLRTFRLAIRGAGHEKTKQFSGAAEASRERPGRNRTRALSLRAAAKAARAGD